MKGHAMRKIFYPLVCLLLLIMLAPAALAATGDVSEADLFVSIFRGVLAGDYVPAAATALVLTVMMLRRFGIGRSALGAGLLTLTASFAGAVLTSLAAGGSISVGIVWAALKVGVTAAGGYSLAKVAADFARRRVELWSPSSTRSVLLAVLGLFGKPPSAETASSRAETSPA